MKKLLLAGAALTALTAAAHAESHASEVKLGVILGFTGPIESLTQAMAAGAELAMSEVTESGALLGGAKVTPVRADSTCVDAGAATAAAERLVTAEGVKGIMGADCSGVTGAVLTNVAVPNGMVMISPQITTTKPAPALSRTSRTGTECPVGAPRRVGSVEKEYCVFAMQIGSFPYPCSSHWCSWLRIFWSASTSSAR